MTGLLELAERCEQATGPDRDMDSAIAIALGAVSVDLSMTGSGTAYYENASCPLARFTASLDAAMTLVPEGCVVMVTNTGVEDHEADFTHSSAIVGPPTDTAIDYSTAATMALALCAAALRARAQHTPEPKQ